VRVPVLELLRRAGVLEKVRIEPTLDAALSLTHSDNGG
jgi:hypothetical protein